MERLQQRNDARTSSTRSGDDAKLEFELEGAFGQRRAGIEDAARRRRRAQLCDVCTTRPVLVTCSPHLLARAARRLRHAAVFRSCLQILSRVSGEVYEGDMVAGRRQGQGRLKMVSVAARQRLWRRAREREERRVRRLLATASGSWTGVHFSVGRIGSETAARES
eukprot:2378314-Pleurochrysis_carterae.AAC.2